MVAECQGGWRSVEEAPEGGQLGLLGGAGPVPPSVFGSSERTLTPAAVDAASVRSAQQSDALSRGGRCPCAAAYRAGRGERESDCATHTQKHTHLTSQEESTVAQTQFNT